MLRKFNQYIHCFWFSISEIWKCNKGYFVYSVIGVVAAVFVPLTLVNAHGKIIDNLIANNTKSAIIFALSLCIVIYLSNLVTDITRRKKVIMDESVKGYLTWKLGAALMTINYQKLEEAETLNNFQFSVTCTDEKRITKLMNVVEEFFSSMVTMLGVLYILSHLNFLIILLLVLVVVVNCVSEVFRMRHVYERHKSEVGISRQLYYARNDLVKKEYAKEIRIYGLLEYVSNKVTGYAQKLCDLWEEAAIKSVKTVGWTYVLQGVQLATVYLYLANHFVNYPHLRE